MAIRINGDNTTAAPGITRGDDTDTGIQFGTDEVSVVTGGTERVKVDNVETVFTQPTGDAKVRIHAAENDSGSDAELIIETSNDFAESALIFNDSSGVGGSIRYNHGDNATRFLTNGTFERMRIQSGGGISFNGDTAAANALDDYEEGTWTPTITSGGWTGFQDILNAKYTKIGRQVTVYLFGNGLQGTGDNTALKVGGLPFTCATNGYAPGSVDFGESIDAGAYCRVGANSTAVEFLRPSGSVSLNRVAIVGNRIGNAYLIFSATYIVA